MELKQETVVEKRVATLQELEQLVQHSDEPLEVEIRPGMTVRVRAITQQERSKCLDHARDPQSGNVDNDEFNSMMICLATVEPKISPADIETIKALPLGVWDKWYGAVLKVSGMGLDLEAKKKS